MKVKKLKMSVKKKILTELDVVVGKTIKSISREVHKDDGSIEWIQTEFTDNTSVVLQSDDPYCYIGVWF